MFKKLKIPHLNLIPVIFISMMLFKFINSATFFQSSLDFVASLFSYFLWGFGIAYLLNPLMVYLEKKFKLRRIFSISLIYSALLVIIVFTIIVVSPKIARNLKEISMGLPYYINETEIWISSNISNLEILDKYNVLEYIEAHLGSIGNQAKAILNTSFSTIVENTISFTSTVLDFIFGLIISLYMLKDKELLIRGIKRILYAVVEKDKVDHFLDISREAHITFSKFISGKALDSLIIGILCFIGLSIIGAPYTLLISLIVGITNMIPYFGPFIGMIPAGIITLFVMPSKFIWVLLFIFLLQQVDGFFLGPTILGDSVGIRAFWVITATIVGGQLFGVMGMFLGTPALAVAKRFTERYLDAKLKQKNIDI